MKLRSDQLAASLSKSLLPIYLITGEEPLQLGEAADEIRLAARKAGYIQREVITIDNGHEWPQLLDEASSLSIFADQKLIELRMSNVKPGVEGGKALQAYCQQMPEQTVLLIIATGKLDAAAQKSQWFQALDAAGGIVQVWPLLGRDLLDWLQRRAARKGMDVDAEAVKSLAMRVEGNLLAAAQEIEKLYILHGHARIDQVMIEADVADSSRFDVFKLTDALLQGKTTRAIKILNNLRAEAVAAPVVLWAIAKELRVLCAIKPGVSLEAVFKKYSVWDKHKQHIQQAAARLSNAQWQKLLRQCAQADRQIKGQADGDCWETLFVICLAFCGKLPNTVDSAAI